MIAPAAAARRSRLESPRRTVNRRTRHTGAWLFVTYALASLVPVSVLGAVLIREYQADAHSHALDQGRAQAAVIEQMAIAPAISGADLEKGLNGRERGRLRSATDLAIFHGSVVRLRLRGFDGKVSFSDDGTVMGGVPISDSAFKNAARGRIDARVMTAGGPFTSATIRVLQPVIAESSGQAIGVLEVYLPYEEIAAKAQADTREAITRLALGLMGLYAVLALISWLTTRALRRHAAENEHQALHDPLTGLPNRELFRRVAEDRVTRSRSGEGGALVLVDLDHFKEVNDTLGHHAGDELLCIVARRLQESLRTDDTVARLGGDEFGIILPGTDDREETVKLLLKARHELSRDIMLEGSKLSVEASFGVCFYPDDANRVEDLLQRADAAMYQGKHGPSGVVVYEPSSSRPATEALVMQGELRRALEHDEFVLHYQPKIDLRSGRVSSLEALIRWQHPERGLLLPAEFLAVAERCELIEPLTRWVVGRALADCAQWQSLGHDWEVAVNVSARNLCSLDFVTEILQMLHGADLRPDRLCLEVTETALAFDVDLAGQVVGALTAAGIAMSVDDFGVGFTGIAQLRGLNMAEIKIDRLFIEHLVSNPEDQAIVGSVIQLAHSLGCVVTGEGIETPDVAEWLMNAGCDRGQGYLWQRPTIWTDIVETFGDSVTAFATNDLEVLA